MLRVFTELLLPQSIAEKIISVRHLIVSPVLGIGIVPFAILRPFKSDGLLIDKMSVSILPGIFDVKEVVERWQPKFLTPLVVGNPYLPSSSDWVIPPLLGAEEEARAVSQIIGATPLIGKAATKQAILTRVSESDLLYFATHGIADSADPLQGGFLMLSATELNKGWWTAKEIQDSKLKARIAILSACQTGLGQVHDAGIIGLARAFQIAGVPRVVMSLWKVDDKATAELMRSFIKHLQQESPSEALRLAMLDTRKQHPAPSRWASFVLFGTPR